MNKIKNSFLHLPGYNCFGCCPDNPFGLKLEFYEDGDYIVSTWIPGKNYQGWLNVLHGGIAATLIDEIAGWTVQRKMQVTGMTTDFILKYRSAVSIEKPVVLKAKIGNVRRNIITVEVTLEQENKVCTTANCTYFTFSKETCAKSWHFTGCEIEEEDI